MICVHDIIAITGLAVRISIAYKDASNDYRHISEEVAALKLLVDKVAPHFQSTPISREDYEYGEKVLKDCQGVLEDLNSFIGKYQKLASINQRLVLNRVKLGKEDITVLQVQLISKTVLLNGFIRSCEYAAVQAQLAALLGLCGTNSSIPVPPIASFAANADTEAAYKQFCKYLHQEIGVTDDIIRQKEDEIFEILRSQGMVDCNQIGDSKVRDQDRIEQEQLLEMAYKEFCESLYQLGVTEDLQPPKDKILRILRSRGVVASSQTSGRDTEDQDSAKAMPSFRPGPQFWLNSEAIGGYNSALLHLAANNCHIGTVELLFGKGAPIDQDNNSLLHCAAGGGYTDTVKLLLGKGAPIEARNPDGYTPLELAAKNGHAMVMKLLLGNGASIDMNPTNNTLLHHAAKSGHTSVIELLLAEGSSVEALDKDKNTALHLAAWKGHIATMDFLLAKGASVTAKGLYGYTPLHFAARGGHTGAVELLLENGASIEAKHDNGGTPLNIAASNGHTEAVELLLTKGASVEAKWEDGDTSLHVAAYYGHTGVVELLLAKGASVEVKCEKGNTSLHNATWEGHTGAMELLLEKGASIEAKRENGCTPLHLAAIRGHTRTVELLLEKGASIGVKDKFNRTPLHCAKRKGHTDIVQLLKAAGGTVQPLQNRPAEVPIQPLQNRPAEVTLQPLQSRPAEVPIQPLQNRPAEVPVQPPTVRDTRKRSTFLASIFGKGKGR